jgi:hypothetical protein
LKENNLMSTSDSLVKILDREFLDVRAILIDLAASLDRIQREAGSTSGDRRIDKIMQAARILAQEKPNRVEQVQLVFSMPYDEQWKK